MKVAIVDYGMGNLHSVLKSAQYANQTQQAQIFITSDPQEILAADKVIFPGQGAMPDCMKSLHEYGLGEAILSSLQIKPFFGICVGAQLLFAMSEEGQTKSLGWCEGVVKRFEQPLLDESGQKLKVPHMGWNNVHQTKAHPLFKNIAQDSRFYFVHSYYFAPEDQSIVLATSEYPHEFACVIGRDNVFATQFHPEKSHQAGLQLMANFLDWDGQS
ncbi:imidazole glycerol phosphate synthase subunit HisH [Neisseria sp. Ec49-e6-T10]|uniref:imidazole glycerol phosphate synthase subunit HisH n=1 Tax=Neisseria sp. Ec49-e6-T10 TaxID=3140744 RepID=UPI003EB9765E